jgi:large subunit ribosomal protein L18
MKTSRELSDRRRQRTSGKVKRNNSGRPRLAVYRSGKHIYAQIIIDKNGTTVAAASTIDIDVRSKLKTGSNIEAASLVGKVVAERAKKAGVNMVVFDRGGYLYHGRVKALAEAARQGGLSF